MKPRENQRHEEEGIKRSVQREGGGDGGGGLGALTTCHCMINSHNPIISPPVINNSGQAGEVAARAVGFRRRSLHN